MNEQWRFQQFLLSFLGIPYVWGGSSPLVGLDCSGLSQIVYARLGLDPPLDQTADGLYRYFLAHGTKVTKAELGVAVFYGLAARVTHTGVAFDALHMIEAAGGGSDVTSPAIALARGADVRIGRIARRSDLVAMIRPQLPW